MYLLVGGPWLLSHLTMAVRLVSVPLSLLQPDQMLPVPLRVLWAQQKPEAQAGGTPEVT